MVALGLVGYPMHNTRTFPGAHAVGGLHVRISGATFSNIFYPCARGGIRYPYWREPAVKQLAKMTGLPSWLLAHLTWSSATREAAPVLHQDEKFPLVIFSHGTWGSCEMYTGLCRALASCGYVVVALEHEDGSGCYAQDASGSIIMHRDPVPATNAHHRPPMLAQRINEIDRTLSALRAADAPETPLAAVMAACDSQRPVFVGHSFGGTTVARAAQLGVAAKHEALCTIQLDTWLGGMKAEPGALESGVPLPSLSIDSEE